MLLNTPPVLVIVGFWNHSIFTRDWIKYTLFPTEEVIIEQTSIPNSTLIFGAGSYKVFIQDNRLTFLTEQHSPEVYDIIEKKAVEIITLLKHTPLTAFGINFAFDLRYNQTLNEINPEKDQAFFKSQGYFCDTTLLHRVFTKDTHQFNLNINFSPTNVRIDVNINFQINDSNLFLKLFSKGILDEKKIETERLIQSNYGTSSSI